MFQVVQKLKMLKKSLKILNLQRNIVSEAADDRKSLQDAQYKLQTSPQNIVFQQEERKKYMKYKQSSYMLEVYLQQRSKVNWIKLGDDNINYFYSIIK